MNYTLAIAALAPPLILLIFIYRADKADKEPIGLIMKLVLLGALTTIPASIIEALGEDVILPNFMMDTHSVLYNIIVYFIVVAWTEEGVKHFVLKRGCWKSPAFDYTFDAVVYSVAVSLGFAAAENVMYVFSYGLETAKLRALTAIPGHCIFGIYMGYFYGKARWHFTHFNEAAAKRAMRLSMLVPVLLHGFYDFSVSMGSNLLLLVFFAYLIILDIVAIVSIRKFSKNDQHI